MNFHSLIYCILTKVLCTCMSNLWAPDTYHFKAELWVGTKKKVKIGKSTVPNVPKYDLNR